MLHSGFCWTIALSLHALRMKIEVIPNVTECVVRGLAIPKAYLERGK